MEIICDRCGAVIPDPEWKTARDGDIEYTYFLCPPAEKPTALARPTAGSAGIS